MVLGDSSAGLSVIRSPSSQLLRGHGCHVLSVRVWMREIPSLFFCFFQSHFELMAFRRFLLCIR